MTVYAGMHFDSEERPEVWERNGCHGIAVGLHKSLFCREPESADAMSEAFALLASKMRAAANLPDPDQLSLVEDEVEQARQTA